MESRKFILTLYTNRYKMGRIIALDYGRKRVGVAVTDPLQIIASGLETVETPKLMDFLRQYFSANVIDALVVGLPRQMNGEYSESYKYIEPFVRRFRKEFPAIPVEMVDERFTSKIAFQAMIDGGVKKMQRRDKALVDKVSATIILQTYMEHR